MGQRRNVLEVRPCSSFQPQCVGAVNVQSCCIFVRNRKLTTANGSWSHCITGTSEQLRRKTFSFKENVVHNCDELFSATISVFKKIAQIEKPLLLINTVKVILVVGFVFGKATYWSIPGTTWLAHLWPVRNSESSPIYPSPASTSIKTYLIDCFLKSSWIDE